MIYMLDTNICIYIIKHTPSSTIKIFHTLKIGEVGISSITLAELHYGVAKSTQKAKNHDALEKFIAPLEINEFNSQAAKTYGEIRTDLEAKGKLIGPMDMLIAAHALSLDVTLITNNEKEFERVKYLKLDNWIAK